MPVQVNKAQVEDKTKVEAQKTKEQKVEKVVVTGQRGRQVSVLNKTEMNNVVKGLTTTSSKIRALNVKGYTRSEIARFLNKRYQHVRNVLITPLASEQK